MTKYTVVWHRGAEADLANLWLATSDRQEITVAANQIDQTLSRDAQKKGIPITGATRELEILPLRILYVVNELDRIVRVTRVRLQE